MVSDDHDEMIERLAARLRPLPEVDPAARARVLVAVAAERERDREAQRRPARRPRILGLGVAGLAAAALLAALVLRQQRQAPPVTTIAAASTKDASAPPAGEVAARGAGGAAASVAPPATPSGPNATLVASERNAVAPQPVQLVFRAPRASRVSVVGDFSGWDPSRAVMTRDSGSGLWSVTLALTPGRHVYAFLVDDSVWVRDPRAPAAPDADFGRPGSVLLVGRP